MGLPILATSLTILTDRYIAVKLLMGHYTREAAEKSRSTACALARVSADRERR